MSVGREDWRESLLRPSDSLSVAAVVLGSWFLMLNLLNIITGAYSGGKKVLWIDFITNGSKTNEVHEIGIVLDDVLFGILGITVFALGAWSLGKERVGGFGSWFVQIWKSTVFTSLLSTEQGGSRTVASWMIAIGTLFYTAWGIMHSTWVDPGVYSVTIAMVSMGFGVHTIEDSKSGL